jgi:hypothetical protein
MPDTLQAVLSTSPRRQILWSAQDPGGSQQSGSNGQPVQSALYPQVVAEELGTDQMQITKQPVEQGATITDHAFKLPAQIQIRASWSFASGGSGAAANYLQQLYSTLLTMQVQRSLVTLVTGKRIYISMLLETLRVRTDEATEYVLEIVANFQEIILVTTQTVSVPPSGNMQSPQLNGATQNQGTQNLQPGSNLNQGSATQVMSSSPPLGTGSGSEFAPPSGGGGATGTWEIPTNAGGNSNVATGSGASGSF